MAINYKWLEKKVFQRKLVAQDRKTLANTMTVEHFDCGDTIITENENGGSLYILKSGCVDVIIELEGELIKIVDLGEGSQFGDMSFIAEESASATIIARADCEAYRITRDAFSQLFVYHQSVAKDLTFSIMRNMSRNLKWMNSQRAVLLRDSKEIGYSGA